MAIDYQAALSAIRDTLLNRRIAYAVIICCSLALGVPRLVDWLGLQPVVSAYRPWIGGSVLIAGAIAIVDISVVAHTGWKAWRQSRARHQLLRELGQDERLLLRAFIVDERTTVLWEIAKPGVGSLTAKGVIFRSSQLSVSFTTFPFTIQPWAYRHLLANPDIVGLGLPKPKGP